MRIRIISIASTAVVLAIVISLIVLEPAVFTPGNASPSPLANNQRLNGSAGVGPSAQTGPQPAATYAPAGGREIAGQEARHDTSPALRDIPLPAEPPPATLRESGRPEGDNDATATTVLPQITDPVRQASLGNGASPLALTTSLSFAGISNLDSVYPADTTGDVGPNNYVQWVNLHFQIFNKSGVSLYGPASGNTLWSGFGAPCQTVNDGDVQVLYDSLADRWVMGQFVATTTPFGECLAISTTSDPTGSYYRYFFQFSSTVFYDYPKLGLWPDGYYLTDNRFDNTSGSFLGASAIAMDRNAMLAGAAASFQEFQTDASFGTLLPANLDGTTTPPAGEPMFIAEIGTSALHLWKFHVDWTTPANSTFTGPATLPVASFNQLCPNTRSCIPQPGTAVGLDGVGDRLMQRLQYRNFGSYESLVITHSVNAASSGLTAGIRWYEIRNPNGAPAIFQQSTFSPDATNRWLGSAALDQNGDIALGYSVSSSTVYPGIRYTGRLVSDPAGQLTLGETTLTTGAGSQTGTASRWGDYANMVLDPSDNCTFWFTTEYISTTGPANWHTEIGTFKFPSCGASVPTSTPTAIATQTPIATACHNLVAGYCRSDTDAQPWIDVTTKTNTGITGDDQVKSVTLPFAFTFFGASHTTVNISSNGNIHFGTASTAYFNTSIPNASLPNAMLAPFWDDLNPSAGGAIYTGVSGAAPNRVFVVEWSNVPHYGTGKNGATFEVQLVEGTNAIWFLYQQTTFGSSRYDNGASATSGIENAAGSAGNPYSFNKAVLTAGKVIHFWPQ